jgi:hypothetical protein
LKESNFEEVDEAFEFLVKVGKKSDNGPVSREGGYKAWDEQAGDEQAGDEQAGGAGAEFANLQKFSLPVVRISLNPNADNKSKVKSNFQLIIDTNIVLDIDIHGIIFVFDWFLANIVDPNFACANFTRAVYVADKLSRDVSKSTKTATAAPNMLIATVSITINVSTDVLTSDTKRQAAPVSPVTTAPLKPHPSWKSAFAASSRNSSNICQLHNTEILLASSSPLYVLEFDRKLVSAANPAEIDLVSISAFDPDHVILPHNRCDDIIFEIDYALAFISR